jgi:hypothetical protein
MAALCTRRTKAGARESVEQAIKITPTPELANYIRDN